MRLEQQSDYHFQSYYLPKTLLTARITASEKGRNITAGWEKVVDRDYLYRVNYERSSIHEDDLHIETNEKGFLKSVQAFSTDKTADIVEAGAKILMTSISGTPFGSSNRSLRPDAALGEAQIMEVQFDPFDANDFTTHNRILSRHGYCFAVFDRDDTPLKGSCNTRGTYTAGDAWHATGTAAARKYKGAGFFYRRSTEHRVMIYRGGSKGWAPIWSGWHAFEQMGDLNEIRVDRGAFIKHEATLTFTEGSLTKYTMKKPSEVLGFMAIPSVIVNTVVQIPGLQATAAENKNSVREREIAVREKEVALRERELKLVPVGVTANGRSAYEVAGAVPRSAVDTSGLRSLADDKQQFLASCRDQKGLDDQDCMNAWLRRNGN